MIIVIDTNTVKANYMFRTETTKAFLEFVTKPNGGTVFIPRIVWDEIMRNYRLDLHAKLRAYIDGCKHLTGTLVGKPEFLRLELDIEAEANRYMQWLRTSLGIKEAYQIIKPQEDTLSRVTKRAVEKRKPFKKENENEFKDSLIWESLLDILSPGYSFVNNAGTSGRLYKEVAFISADGKAFCAKNQDKEKELHPDLQAEIDEVLPDADLWGVTTRKFYFYTSISDFLAAHNPSVPGFNYQLLVQYFEHNMPSIEGLLTENLKNSATENANLVRQRNSDYRLPYLEAEFEKYKIFRRHGPLGDKLYALGNPKRTVVFTAIHFDIEIPVTYTPISYPYAESEQTIGMHGSCQLNLSIQVKNDGQLGEMQIEDFKYEYAVRGGTINGVLRIEEMYKQPGFGNLRYYIKSGDKVRGATHKFGFVVYDSTLADPDSLEPGAVIQDDY